MSRRFGLFRVLVVAVAVSTLSCDVPEPSVPEVRLAIAAGVSGGVHYRVGDALANVLNAKIPGLQAKALLTVGSVVNVDAIEAGEADVALTQGDIAYAAYTRGTPLVPRPHSSLRAIAVLYTNTAQMAVGRQSRIHSVSGLRGRRVSLGAIGSHTEVTARMLLEAHGLALSDVAAEHIELDEASGRLARGTLDASFAMGSYPVPALEDANDAIGIRLLPVADDVVRRIRDRDPFYRPAVIPRGTYSSQDADVRTVGIDNLLICREGLSAELVHRITEVLLDSIADLARAHPGAAAIDPEQAPATPIPLHQGAARFYRGRELSR